MSAIVLGESGPVLQGVRYTKTPTDGWRTTHIYKGPRAAILGLLSQAQAAGNPTIVIDESGPNLTCEISYDKLDDGSTETPQNSYELLGNDLQKDIYEHPSAVALGNSTLETIRKRLADPNNESLVIPAGDASTLYGLLLRGTSAYIVSQYVFRWTQTTSSSYAVQIAFSNIEKVYTSAQLIAEVSPPSTLRFSILDVPVPTAQSGYTSGWLKKTPTVSSLAGGKVQVVQEWWFEQWSQFLYTAV